MRKAIYLLLIVLPMIFSCSEETILPTTGSAILVDTYGEFTDADYYVVTEEFFLSEENPYTYPDALIKGKVSQSDTVIKDLNAGVYYIIFHKSNSKISIILQIKAGETIEKILT